MNRRTMLAAAAGIVTVGVAGLLRFREGLEPKSAIENPHPPLPFGDGEMRLREFGSTGMKVSEVGFGSWAIGGNGYGAVEEQESLRALSRAEELGCNFVDTALVYGDSEKVLGEFLDGRRSRWIIATKYSGQEPGITATVETQLRNLRTDVIDFYQIHWVPRGKDESLFEEISQLKKEGKIRFVGVSLYSAKDIDYALARPEIDGFQVAFNLLEPDPFLARVRAIRSHRKGVIIRSALREGFLTGKFKRDVTFSDPNDQRHEWSREQIERTVDMVERLRFLELDAGSMVVAAARYPLSFPEVSTVILGTKSEAQADTNFGMVPGATLSKESLERVHALQLEMGLGNSWPRLLRKIGFAES